MNRRTYPGLTGAVTDPNDEMFSFLDDFHTLILAAGLIKERDIAFADQAIRTIRATLTGPHSWPRREQEQLCGAFSDLLFAVNAVGHVAQEISGANKRVQSAAYARLSKNAESRRADEIIFPIVEEEWRKNQKQRTANALAEKCFNPVQAALQEGRESGLALPKSIGGPALRKRINGYLKTGRLDSHPANNGTTEQSSS